MSCLRVEVLPRQLDEEVTCFMVGRCGEVLTRLTEMQFRCLGVLVKGPYMSGEF